MRSLFAVIALVALVACVTPPESPEAQAAHFGPVPDPPTRQQLLSAKQVTDFVWLSSPQYTDYVLLYPRDAWQAEAEASVQLDCLVREDGSLACAAEDDEWAQYDFEQAARNLSTRFRVASQSRSGEPTSGRRLRIRVAFRLR
jgi:hypothetical protein